MNREALAEEMAYRMLDAVDMETVANTFTRVQYDHYLTLDEDQLKEEAENLGIDLEDFEDE